MNTTPTPPSATPRLAAWLDAHAMSLSASLGRLGKRPAATTMTVGVMGVAMALPLCLALVLGELQRFSGSLRESREVAVFLTTDTTADAVHAWAKRWSADPSVAAIVLRSPEDGLNELRELDALGGTLDVLDYNPLPFVALVEPAAEADDAALAERLRALPEVDFVQHDAEWRRRLGAWLTLGQRVTAVAAMLLGLGVLLVVGNTVRLDIQDRAAEIATVRLLGASSGFIRRPFVYLGACYGALAGLLAIAIAAILQRALAVPVADLVAEYAGSFSAAGIGFDNAVATVFAAVALGWLGAWLAVGHHLRSAASTEGSE
ncbi:MAG: permease-like cell division protein FtsX [Pseudomarimonas sp.]